MKKIIKYIILTPLIFITICILSFVYITEYRITNVAKYENPKNNYTILLQSVGEPEWPFGDTTVKVTLLNNKGRKVKTFVTDISDDGASVREENIEVKWCDNYVEVVLKGGEQEDDIYQIKYKQKWGIFNNE